MTNWLKITAALLILVGAVLVTTFIYVRRTLLQPYQAFPETQIVVTIPDGASVRESLDLLAREGVLANPDIARIYWTRYLGDPLLKAGEYRFSGPSTTPEVLSKLVRGEVLTHQVTILEGWTLQETAAHLAESGFGDYQALLEEMSTPDRIADFDPEAWDLEGYLFPDTYSFSRGTPEAEVVSTLVDTFRERFAEAVNGPSTSTSPSNSTIDSPSQGARLDGRTNREILILASIVEKEALVDSERPVIAGVYDNRLERGIGLYADPTVIYALKLNGTWDGNIRRRDLDLDSPYNTYRRVGLPPGPICSPGYASLAAAARPADVPYFYFVSRNDGTHVFAESLAEHNRNVYKWQKLYWRNRWAEERAEKAAAASKDSPVPGQGDAVH